jgi:hypothetical protein
MKSKVTVVANADGNVVSPSVNNPEWASIRVKQTTVDMQNGFAKEKTRYAYIHGTTKMLSGWGVTAGQELDGQIVIRESLTPFNPKNPAADAKIAGTSGVVCRSNGNTIYRKLFFETNPSKFNDELIAHNNTEEIQLAYDTQAAAAQAESDLSL